MRRQVWNLKRDAAEGPICEALEAVGIPSAPEALEVNGYWRLSGRGLGDLLIRFRGVLYVGEVKTGTAKLRKTQGAFPIWRTPEQVLREIGAAK